MKLYKNTIIITFCLLTLVVYGQDYGKLDYIYTLPNRIDENSGITTLPTSSLLYMVNDSGGKNSIYGLDFESGHIQQEIKINNATNVDWEDLATDGNTIYIGDFGNNDNDRKDLKIYWVAGVHKLAHATATVTAQATSFYFEDQQQFPPKKKNLNFDVEAFVIYKNNFYLFTRNRSKDFDGTVKLYCVPVEKGHHKAVLLDTFQTCDTKDNCQITGAAIHQATGKLALLSANKVWLFSDYDDTHFFKGTIDKIKLKHHSQKEAICFKDETTLYISEEKSKKSKGNVYLLHLK